MIKKSTFVICIVFTVLILSAFIPNKTFFGIKDIYGMKSQTLLTLYGSFGNINSTRILFERFMQNKQSEWQESADIALASPWLFNKSQTRFPYLGMHNDLDALLRIMGKQSKKITVLGFNWQWQVMIQNNIYTLVRFARTSNYIVVTGDEETLLVCIELNLPCYNASSYMVNFRTNVSTAHDAVFHDQYFLVLVWYWVPLCLNILRKGFTIMRSDADISYGGKDIWKTFEIMVETTGADLIFMREAPVNTGQFYAVPTDRTISFFEEWIASRKVLKGSSEQTALVELNNKIYMICDSNESCSRVKTLPMNHSFSYPLQANNRKYKMTAVLTYPSSFARFGSICPPQKIINPCNEDLLYVHPICIFNGSVPKINKLKELGFWMMSSSCATSILDVSFRSPKSLNISVTRCIPLPLVRPEVENSFLRCNNSEYIASA
jgi:hypothetical protein